MKENEGEKEMVQRWRSTERENKRKRQIDRRNFPLPAQGLETKGEIRAKGR